MNDLDALLAACVANPDEDTPRLAYADELQARGLVGDEDQAAYIRTTIEYLRLTRLHEQLKADRADSIRLREVAAAWQACRWNADLPKGIGWVRGDLKQRGFVEVVACDAERFVEIGDEIRQLCPLLRRVVLTSEPVIDDRGTSFRLRGDREYIPAAVIYEVRPPDTLAHLCLRYRWQGITFDIIPQSVARRWTGAVGTDASDLRNWSPAVT